MTSQGELYERDPEAWNAYLAQGNARQGPKASQRRRHHRCGCCRLLLPVRSLVKLGHRRNCIPAVRLQCAIPPDSIVCTSTDVSCILTVVAYAAIESSRLWVEQRMASYAPVPVRLKVGKAAGITVIEIVVGAGPD